MHMKKNVANVLVIAALCITSNLFAQKPAQGEKTAEVTLNLQTGTSPISFGLHRSGSAPAEIRLRYFISDLSAIRLRLGMAGGSTTNRYAGSGVDAEVKVSNGFGLSFFPGYEMHFEGTNKLSPYVGGQLGISLAGGRSVSASNSLVENPGPADIISGNKLESSAGSTFGFGAGVFMGADYYFLDGVYLGAEFGLSLFNMTSTGDGESKSTLSGAGTTTTKILGSSSTDYFGASVGGLRLGIKF